MIPNEKFDLLVKFIVPESEQNFEIGNFMVSLKLFDGDGNILRSSSRPVKKYLESFIFFRHYCYTNHTSIAYYPLLLIVFGTFSDFHPKVKS